MYPRKLEKINVLGKNITGKKFNELFSRKELLKLTNEKEKHVGLQFKDGLNSVDTYNIDVYNSQHDEIHGIHFTTTKKAWKWIYYSDRIMAMRYMREVAIPDDAEVFIFSTNKFKTNKIILGERQDISEKIYMDYVKHERCVAFIPDEFITKDMCKIAVTKKAYTLHFVPSRFKNMKLCMRSIKGYGCNLKDVPKDLINKEMCIEAVTQSAFAIEYVPKEILDKDICLAAVRNYSQIINDIPKNLIDRDIYLEAVKTNGYILSLVPTNMIDREMCVYALDHKITCGYNSAIEFVPTEILDKELAMLAVKNYKYAIRHIPLELKLRNIEICAEAAKNMGKTIEDIILLGIDLPKIV